MAGIPVLAKQLQQVVLRFVGFLVRIDPDEGEALLPARAARHRLPASAPA
ncbi:MAG: hypothetical protein RMJ88_16500 [Thermogemmata sp.]|nr:hypothetical protein [Thermogemmata sp.]